MLKLNSYNNPIWLKYGWWKPNNLRYINALEKQSQLQQSCVQTQSHTHLVVSKQLRYRKFHIQASGHLLFLLTQWPPHPSQITWPSTNLFPPSMWISLYKWANESPRNAHSHSFTKTSPVLSLISPLTSLLSIHQVTHISIFGPNLLEPLMDSLPKCQANFTSLTPLTFLMRAAACYANRTSVIYEGTHFTWAQTYERCRRLASSLRALNIARNDVVSGTISSTI